jgi:hypothetical protein
MFNYGQVSGLTAGDLIRGGSNGVAARLPVGANGQCLAVSGGLPAWGACSGGGGGGISSLNGLSAATQLLSRTNDTNVTLAIGTSGSDTHTFTLGWTGTLAAARGGTGAATANANLLFAGPSSGGAAAPGFRALVPADIGIAGNCTGNANGGALTVNGSNQIDCSDDDGGNVPYAAPLTVTGGNLTLAASVPACSKYTVGFASLTDADDNQDITLFTLPAQGVITGVEIKHAAAFTGTFTGLTVSVDSPSGGSGFYASPFDVMTVASNTNYQMSDLFKAATFASEAVNAHFTSVGANLNTASAGSVDIRVCTVTLP